MISKIHSWTPGGQSCTRCLGILLVLVLYGTETKVQAGASLSLIKYEPNESAGTPIWTYKFTFTEVTKDLLIRLLLPEGAAVILDEGIPDKIGGYTEWTVAKDKCCQAGNGTYSFKVNGTSKVKNGLTTWIVKFADNTNPGGEIQGPEARYDPSLFRMIFAGGLDIGIDDYIEFKEQDDHLLIVNDSPVRASGLIGGAFKIGSLKKRPVELYASLQFTDNTTRIIDGFATGVMFGLQQYLSVGVGYSLRKQSELSFGFQRAAAQYVKSDPPPGNFPLKSDMSGLATLKDYDGLPLKANGVRFFSGSPIIDSFNHSIFFGLFFPLDFKTLLGAKK